ncbi:MAG: T9SS type A sorting domain-containing protein [Bacteroidetes bacterium]|nr:T9SS type A sorting domain-containing protein [Bacteroidota bacterium]
MQSGDIDLTGCSVITDIKDIPWKEDYDKLAIKIFAYPNPATSDITLAFQNTSHHTTIQLECFNIYGQQVHTENIWKGQQETKIDIRDWAKGLYFAVVKSEGKVAGTGRFVRK